MHIFYKLIYKCVEVILTLKVFSRMCTFTEFCSQKIKLEKLFLAARLRLSWLGRVNGHHYFGLKEKQRHGGTYEALNVLKSEE